MDQPAPPTSPVTAHSRARIAPLDFFSHCRKAIIAISLVALAGCHADMTYRLDFHSDRTVTIAIKEKIDDQFFTLATSQAKNGDPFGLTKAETSGWDIQKSLDAEDNHVIVLTKTVGVDDLGRTLTDNAGMHDLGKSMNIDPASFHTEPGLFTDRQSFNLNLPPFMPAKNTSGDPFGAAGAGMAASIIGLHLELRTPGKLLSTNGDLTPDGFTRWTLGLMNASTISYVVETPNIAHILIAAAGVVLVGIGIVLALRRRKVANASDPAKAM